MISESKTDLQNQLDVLFENCVIWKLKVNIDKSKIMVFSKGRPPNNLEFRYDNMLLEIVNEFKYLGVVFARSGGFVKEKKYNADKATRAMFDILKKGRLHNLSIKSQLHLFGHVTQPILLYCCEVLGTGNNAVIERVHLKVLQDATECKDVNTRLHDIP